MTPIRMTAPSTERDEHCAAAARPQLAMLVVLVALVRAVLRHHHRQDDEVRMSMTRTPMRTQPHHRRRTRRRHRRHGRRCPSPSVPLYRLFCAVTGYGGTPQIGAGRRARRRRRSSSPCASTPTPIPTCPGTSARRRTRSACRSATSSWPSTPRATRPARRSPASALYNVTPDKAGEIFPQDRLLLLQPADAGSRPADAVPAQLLGRSGDRQGSQHGGRPHDHAVLHVLPHARRRREVRRAGARPARMSVR